MKKARSNAASRKKHVTDRRQVLLEQQKKKQLHRKVKSQWISLKNELLERVRGARDAASAIARRRVAWTHRA